MYLLRRLQTSSYEQPPESIAPAREPSTASLYVISTLTAILLIVFLRTLNPSAPIGQYWWDTLALAGAAQAVEQGLTPSVHFWSPMIAPIYLKWVSLKLGDIGSYYFIENTIQAFIASAIYIGLAHQRLKKYTFYTFWALLLLCTGAPTNHSNVISSAPSYINYAGSYNRLCDGLLLITFLLPTITTHKQKVRITDLLLLSTILVIALYTKISCFQLAAAFMALTATHPKSKLGLKHLIQIATIVAAVALLVWVATGIGPQYFNGLQQLAQFKSKALLLELPQRLAPLWDRHWFEISTLTLMTITLLWNIWHTRKHNDRPDHMAAPMLTLAMHACALTGTFFFTITNYGDMGFLPLSGYALSLSAITARTKERRESADTTHTSGRTDFQKVFLICAALLLASDYLFYARWARGFVKNSHSDSISLPSSHSFFNKHYSIARDELVRRPTITDTPTPKANEKLLSIGSFASYILEIDSALNYLKKNLTDKDSTVYAIDFPAYIFSLAGNFKIPKNTYPWLLYGHELDSDAHPDPKVLFSNVDVVAISKCSLHARNRGSLESMYASYIESHYTPIFESACWLLYGNTKVASTIQTTTASTHKRLPTS